MENAEKVGKISCKILNLMLRSNIIVGFFFVQIPKNLRKLKNYVIESVKRQVC